MEVLTENEKNIRKIWAILFFLLPVINFFIAPSIFSQWKETEALIQELAIGRNLFIGVFLTLSTLFLAIMYLVYYRIYKKHGTWLLLFLIVTYPPSVLYQLWSFYSQGRPFLTHDIIMYAEGLVSFYLYCRMLMINRKIKQAAKLAKA